MSVKDFGSKLKSARLESGLSQRSLGLSIGLSDKTISSYESSRSYPNLEILKKLSEKLRKPIGYFFSNELEDITNPSNIEELRKKNQELENEITVLRKMLNREE